MSKMAYCPRGGQEGIYVTKSELKWHRMSDCEGIPIPDIPFQELQKRRKSCKENHDEMENAIYWETDTGSHGWCCAYCGLVLQWG